jgi:hypothetical protein
MTFPRTITCPIPENLSPLSPNGYRLSIQKLPSLQFFCQEASIPSVGLGDITQNTPFVDIHIPGEKLNYGSLELDFIVDSKMENYRAILNWLEGLGFPDGWEQYATFVRESYNPSSFAAETITNYSDGVLSILSSSNTPLADLYFVDLFPISLSSINFTSTSRDVNYVIGKVTFKYTSFKLK